MEGDGTGERVAKDGLGLCKIDWACSRREACRGVHPTKTARQTFRQLHAHPSVGTGALPVGSRNISTCMLYTWQISYNTTLVLAERLLRLWRWGEGGLRWRLFDTCRGHGPAVRQTGTYPSARDERDLFRPLKRRAGDPNLESSYQTHLVLETRAVSAHHHPKGQDGYRRICCWYPTSRTGSGLDSVTQTHLSVRTLLV